PSVAGGGDEVHGDAAAGGTQVRQRHVLQSVAGTAVTGHRDGQRVVAVRVEDPGGQRERVLRPHIRDVLPEIPAVEEDQRPVVAAGPRFGRVADGQADGGVLAGRDAQVERGAVPGGRRVGGGGG